MTRLEAVNYIMSRAGLGPVSALQTGTSSEAANAERELDRTSLEIQKLDWHSMTFKDKTISRDVNLEYIVPNGTITIDTYGEDAHKNVALIGEKLYDHDNNTFSFPDDETLKVRIKTLYELECVPYPIRSYIVNTAVFRFVSQYGTRFMAPNEYAVARQDAFSEMQQSKADARRFNATVSNNNILKTSVVRDVMGTSNSNLHGSLSRFR